MGASGSVLANKTIYISYDDTSQDYKVIDFTIKLNKLPVKKYINDIDKINECDIIIHLISNSTIKSAKQAMEIDKSIHKTSIIVFLDREIDTNFKITSLSHNTKSICISYLHYNSFESLLHIIISKLNEL